LPLLCLDLPEQVFPQILRISFMFTHFAMVAVMKMMFHRCQLVSLLLLGLPSLCLPATEIELLWTLENVFEMPESAAIDLERGMIYVSNVNEYALDGNGYLSRVSINGELLNRKWITGINSPTGIAINGDRIYFADVDALVIADADSGKVLSRIPAPDAKDFPVLNDVAVNKDGYVFVSGSNSRVIYQLINGSLEIFFADETLLESANGLLIVDSVLIHGGQHWSLIDLATRMPVVSKAFPAPQQPLMNFDGITHDGSGGFLVTVIDDSRIWQLPVNGIQKPLSETAFDGIDLDYQDGFLAVPRVGGSLSLFRLRTTSGDDPGK